MKFQTVKAEEFVQEYLDYPAYDNIRKIASIIDGLKNSSRKVVYYTIKKGVTNQVKTSQFKSKVEEETEYLHGDISGVVETLAKDFTGTNNLPLLQGHGNFGTRMIKEASASRYTYVSESKHLRNIFDKRDFDILSKQYFEGNEIEPVYLMPSLPLILVNGSEGISSGFSQKVLNRDVKGLIKAIKTKIKKGLNNHVYKDLPSYNGYKGDVEQTGECQYTVHGVAEIKNTTTVLITEIPFTYDLSSYKKVLDQLEDKNVIKGYNDYSQEEFNIEVKFERKLLSKYENDNKTLLKLLKLSKPITENYTFENENNKIVIYNNVDEVLNHWLDFRMKFLQRKKEHLLSQLMDKISIANAKSQFIKEINDETLNVRNTPKDDIEKKLHQKSYPKHDDSYDYLLNMAIHSLTVERVEKLEEDVVRLEKDKTDLELMSTEEMLLDSLK